MRADFLNSNALQSANKVVELMEREPAINSKGVLTLPRCDGAIEFSNVTVTLPGCDSPALLNVSFKVLAGTHAAFFGPAGSGKSVVSCLSVEEKCETCPCCVEEK